MQSLNKPKSQNNKLFMFFCIVSLIILISCALFITSDFFKIGNIKIEGNKYITTKEILGIININDSKEINVFKLSTTEIEEKLVKDLRISKASATRELPTTLLINIAERKPVGFIEFKYGFVQLDKDAIVFSVSKNPTNINIPIIKGPVLGNIHIGDKVENQDIKNVLLYLSSLDEVTLNSLKEISINNNIISATTTDSILLKIGSEKLSEKAALTVNMLKDIRDNKLKVEYVDLSYSTPVIKILEEVKEPPKEQIPEKQIPEKQNNI